MPGSTVGKIPLGPFDERVLGDFLFRLLEIPPFAAECRSFHVTIRFREGLEKKPMVIAGLDKNRLYCTLSGPDADLITIS